MSNTTIYDGIRDGYRCVATLYDDGIVDMRLDLPNTLCLYPSFDEDKGEILYYDVPKVKAVIELLRCATQAVHGRGLLFGTQNKVYVVKSLNKARSFRGYTLRWFRDAPTWVTGPLHTFGWYNRKSAAATRAMIWNRGEDETKA